MHATYAVPHTIYNTHTYINAQVCYTSRMSKKHRIETHFCNAHTMYLSNMYTHNVQCTVCDIEYTISIPNAMYICTCRFIYVDVGRAAAPRRPEGPQRRRSRPSELEGHTYAYIYIEIHTYIHTYIHICISVFIADFGTPCGFRF